MTGAAAGFTTPDMKKVLVLGVGDIGSAVAHRLFRAGQLVVLQSSRQPSTCRRQMAFSDALFDGEAQLTGVMARLVHAESALSPGTWSIRFIPISCASRDVAIERLRPDVIVDARMHKRRAPLALRGRAPLTIGLGPGFVAGDNVDIAIETSWENLGRILRHGPTLPLRGGPRAIAGHARDRYVYAPCRGVFRTDREIGDTVRRGDKIGRIGRRVIKAPLDGRLRGLTRPGITVTKGDKIIEVIPAGASEKISGIALRPQRIAESVLALVRELPRLASLPKSPRGLLPSPAVERGPRRRLSAS